MNKLNESKIKEIQQRMLEKNGYCLTELGKWIIDIVENDKHYRSNKTNLGFDISIIPEKTDEPIELSNYNKVIDFIDNELNGNTIPTFVSGCGIHSTNYNSDFFLKCLNTWESFISNEFPEFNYNKDEDGEMDHNLYIQFMESNCGDTFLHDYFSKQNLKEILNLYKK